ncbi:MAG: NAD kinase [Cyclobacteriaceae bacterium]|nr:NAD kinase [Cyclobacteriaceae bacterium]
MIRTVAIHARTLSEESIPHFQSLLKYLKEKGVSIHFSQRFVVDNPDISATPLAPFNEITNDFQPDILFSLGGDGTILDAITLIGRFETPILGINMGRLGFLATIAKDTLKHTLDLLFANKYHLDRRTMVSLQADTPLFDGKAFALNEFSILRKDTSSMIVAKTFLNGEYLNTYWADGLMVSTPTGSTGYSLSCGGPIILPHTHNFVITPVSPHNLNIRPLIVPDTSELAFEVESRHGDYLVSLDSRSQTVEANTRLTIVKAGFSANLIRIEGDNFIETLRNKLSWGLDKRN